jgi:hypothetical protein
MAVLASIATGIIMANHPCAVIGRAPLYLYQGCVWGCKECESTESHAVKVVRLYEK